MTSHWRVYWPGDFYYWDFYTSEPCDESQARRELREYTKRKRLPNGVSIEPATSFKRYKSGKHWMWAAE